MMVSQLSHADRECIQAFGTKIDCLAEKNRNEACAPNTGQWFLGHPDYQTFLQTDTIKLLFTTADAGGGKSTLMRTVVDGLQSSEPPSLVAYFFFKDDNDQQRSYSQALSAVVHQLLLQRPTFAHYARRSYEQYGHGIKTKTREMWKILTELAVESQDDIICVLDAIDECEAGGRSELLQDMRQYMQEIGSTTPRLKFIVSSRPSQDSSHPFDDVINCSPRVRHIDGGDVRLTSDIFNVICFKIDELTRRRSLTESTRQQLLNEMSAKNKHARTFLWVKLAFELLDVDSRLLPDSDIQTIQAILAGTPECIGEQFERLLQTSSNPAHARRLFGVILAARRPLKVAEFKVIFSLTLCAGNGDRRMRTYDDLEMISDDNRFKSLVRNTCGLFITFVKDSVHLFHQTAREYLMLNMSEAQSVSPPGSQPVVVGAAVSSQQGNLWKHSITSQEANYIMGKACLDLISFDTTEEWVRKVFRNFATGDFRHTVQDYVSTRPFLMYAACNWYEHLTMSGETTQHDSCRRDNHSMFDLSKPQFWVWFLIACDQVCLSRSIESAAWKDDVTAKFWADLEHFGSMDRGLFLGTCMYKMSSMGAEVGALYYGHLTTEIRTIIDGLPWTITSGYHLVDEFHLANGDWESTSTSKAMSALEEGNKSVSNILLKNTSRPILIWTAISDRQPKALSEILADSANIEWLNYVPEHILSYHGKELGLIHSPDSAKETQREEQQRWNQQYPATFEVFTRVNALPKGDSVFQVLKHWLQRSISPSDFAAELWRAGAFVNASLCRILFEMGVHIDSPLWRDQMTALQVAATFWEHDSLRTMVSLGADALTMSKDGRNALHWFCFAQGGPTKERHQKSFSHRYKKSDIKASLNTMLKKVIEKSYIIEQQDAQGITPLMLAVQVSSTIAKSLLAEGAIVNQTDKCNRSALMHFFIGTESWARPRSVLKSLLISGADARIPDNDGVTTIGYWARRVLSQSLSSLYPGYNAYNIDFYLLDTCGPLSQAKVMADYLRPLNIPLVVAAKLGNARLCEYLLLNGAVPNDHGMMENSPLARNDGSEATVLEEMVWSPLMVAISAKAYVTTALLLENGADVGLEISPRNLRPWSSCKAGITPLHLLIAGDCGRWGDSDLHMATGGRSTGCAFGPAGRPEQPVSTKSVYERMAELCHSHTNLRDEGDSASESEIESVTGRAANDSRGSNLLPFDKLIRDDDRKIQAQSPLFTAIYNHQSSADERQRALMEVMIHHGANVNARTQAGITPLFTCAQTGRTDLAKLLLSRQADANSVTDSGGTALMWAARTGNDDMAELLLDHGADVNAQMHTPTPESGHCYKLQASGSFSFWPTGTCRAPITPLAIAAERGHYSVVKLLLNRGADPNLRIVHHVHGLLHVADRKRRRRGGYTPHTLDSDSDSDPEPQLWKGYISVATALTWARGSVRELLLERGANPSVEERTRECGCVIQEVEGG